MYSKPTRGIALLAVLAAAGCAHSPSSNNWPIATYDVQGPFNPLRSCNAQSAKGSSTRSAGQSNGTTTADDKTKQAETLHSSKVRCNTGGPQENRMLVLEIALEKRIEATYQAGIAAAQRDWGSGDLVTAGGLMAVLGGLADKAGLVNTGAAAGLLGGTGRTRYQYPAQAQAYDSAVTAMSCVQTQVQLFNDKYRGLVLQYGDASERAAASDAPNAAVYAVNKISRRLGQQLQQLNSEPMQRDAIELLAKKVRAAEDAAGKAQKTDDQKILNEVKKQSANGQGREDGGASPDKDAIAAEVEDARGVGRTYAAELAKCTLW